MDDLTILHLSDLHIAGDSENYSRLLAGLLSDIKTETKLLNAGTLIIAVTGDIIHKGNSAAIPAALKFFEELKKILGDKAAKIYIVPGNHDKKRTNENEFLVPAYRVLQQQSILQPNNKKDSFDAKFQSAFWKYHLDSYSAPAGSGYLDLTHKIYKLFGMTEASLENCFYANNTYGVDVVEVKGKRYCFVLLNTAWSCIDDLDNRNLVLGNFQREEIRKQYREIVKNHSDITLTLVLGHHPIGALSGVEEDKLFADMISYDELDADIYLCGHTHDRAAINWSNNRHSISTLVTGIGWPEQQGGNRVHEHTYSMYVFNIDANSTDIYVRSTDDGGQFTPDLRIYTTGLEKDIRKLVYPIRSKVAQTYITLNVEANESPRAFFLSDSFLKYVQHYSLSIAKLMYIVGNAIEADKTTFWDEFEFVREQEEAKNDFEDCYDIGVEDFEKNKEEERLYLYLFANPEGDDSYEDVKEIFHEFKGTLFDMFLAFLAKICHKMQQVFFDNRNSDSEIIDRFHFRYLSDRSVLTYSCLCASIGDDYVFRTDDVTEMRYGDLLKMSFEASRGLIYSINEHKCSMKLKSKWHNFITIVPTIEQNIYAKRRLPTGAKTKYPYLTFGVTTNSAEDDWLLYCMDFFDFKEVLDLIIEQYIQLFRIDIGEFCEWVKNKNVLEKGVEK